MTRTQLVAGPSGVQAPGLLVRQLRLFQISHAHAPNQVKPTNVKPMNRKAVAKPKPTTTKAVGPAHAAAANSGHAECDSDVDNDNDIGATDQSKWSTGPQWSVVFLASLSHALYVAQNPFDDFKKDSPQFIKTVQEVFAVSHPEIVHKFHAKDKFIEKVSPVTCTIPLSSICPAL